MREFSPSRHIEKAVERTIVFALPRILCATAALAFFCYCIGVILRLLGYSNV